MANFLSKIFFPPKPDSLKDGRSYFARWDRAHRAALEVMQREWPHLNDETQRRVAKEIAFAAVKAWDRL